MYIHSCFQFIRQININSISQNNAHLCQINAHLYQNNAHLYQNNAHLYQINAHLYQINAHLYQNNAHLYQKMHLYTKLIGRIRILRKIRSNLS
jgi:hypothetical protein